VKLFAAHAAAVAGRSRIGLEKTAAGFEGLGAFLMAAEACSEASELCRAEGLSRRATSLDRKADELVAKSGGVRTPSLNLSGSGRLLTRREREIATLAASGRSSREIASRLFLSVRTVENHLLHAYTKLGVTSREGLAEALFVVS